MPNAIPISQGIHWTGVRDYDLRTFDIIMESPNGTTYNAYLVQGASKTALIEIAKEGFFDEFLARLQTVCDPATIDYIIVNHTEPDHAGALKALLSLCPNATVCGSATALRFLSNITNTAFPQQAVKDGDTLDLGGKTLRFIAAPFLHWPDSMYTYCPEAEVLFTCDSFGCHYCAEPMFNDELSGDFHDAYAYYFKHILAPFKPHVLSALDKIKDLPLRAICPGHGPMLRADIPKYLEMYRTWSTPAQSPPRAAILYVSAYGYTARLAKAIAEGLQSEGVPADLFDLVTCDKATAYAAMDSAAIIAFGSPTLVGDALPPIWEAIAHLNPIIHKGKIAAAFGAYGWSGEAVPNITARLTQLKFKMPCEPLRVVFNPTEADLEAAHSMGKALAQAL